jgi:hypothetical protein
MIRSENIRELLKKQPFQPFRMHLSNGHSFEVNHPELALVTRETIIVSKPVPGSEEPIGEGFKLISVIQINSIEIMAVTAGAKSN